MSWSDNTPQEALTETYKIQCDDFEITSMYTSCPNAVEEFTRYIYDCDRGHDTYTVGLDIEWAPYLREQRPETLQLCSDFSGQGPDCIVIQLRHLADNFDLNALRRFVRNEKYIFCGVGIKQDIAKLEKWYDLRFNYQIFDLNEGAQRRGIDCGNSLQSLAQRYAKLHFVKDSRMARSDWARHPLSYEQVAYATRDAFASYYVGSKMRPYIRPAAF